MSVFTNTAGAAPAYTAERWPIAAAMLPFGGTDSTGGPIHQAPATEWAKQLGVIRRRGFTEVDPTDTWVRVANLGDRLGEFRQLLADLGLTVPAISTSRRSVVDAQRGDEYLAYSHRLLDAAAELGVPLVSFGFFQEFTPQQQRAQWFWHADGHRDDPSPDARARAADRIRELAEHAQRNDQQITLEMYEDTYVGTAEDALAFLREVDHPACGLNPDLGNLVRLHRPLGSVPEMLAALLPHANYWHVKNYLRDEDPATGAYATFPSAMADGFIDYRAALIQALAVGYRGPLLCEHYGGDALTMIGRNRAYLREVLGDLLDGPTAPS